MWTRLSLRERLLLPMAAMIVGALLLGGLALQIVSPDQFEYENAQGTRSAQRVAEALNAALAAAGNPQPALEAFARGLGTSEAIEFVRPGTVPDRASLRVHDGGVPAWFSALLKIPELGAAYPIRIGTAHVGDIVFNPDLSADIFEKWIGFLAIVSSGSVLMLLAALGAYVTTGTALRPLAQLGAGLTRMRNGDFRPPFPLRVLRRSARVAKKPTSLRRR